jgi:hypothetical protein
VDDVFPFYPGTVIAGTKDCGDLISIGPARQVARVCDRDLVNGVLSLDRAVDWRDGDRVDLLWGGEGSDIGSIETGGGGRSSVQVITSGRRVEPNAKVELALSARGCVPVSAEWWLGDTVKKTGLTVTHAFDEEDDHPVRVRALCEDGRYVWAAYVITCRAAPEAGAPLLDFTFDDSTDSHWWWQWKTYSPFPAQPAKSVMDAALGRYVLEVAAPAGSEPRMPCALYPEHWDVTDYPLLYLTYKCPPGVPLTIKLVTFAKSESLGRREIVIAATDAGASGNPPATTTLAADGAWHDATIDLSITLASHWGGKPTVIKGISMGCWDIPGTAGMKYWLANVSIVSR